VAKVIGAGPLDCFEGRCLQLLVPLQFIFDVLDELQPADHHPLDESLSNDLEVTGR